MMLGAPIWLWLGCAVIIPLVIHLWNKKSARPRLLGTFRFLPKESFASAKSVELHEVFPLMLRLTIIALLTLLLANVFFMTASERTERVVITEIPDGETYWAETEEGDLAMKISSNDILKKGWWNILQQVEYEYRPEGISVQGEFSEDKFQGTRPLIESDINWQSVDSLYTKERIWAAWLSSEAAYKMLTQKRSDGGIESSIEEVALSDMPDSSYPVEDSVRLIINSSNSDDVNYGLKFTANYWGIAWEEQQTSEVARLITSEKSTTLIHHSVESGIADIIEPTPDFGIQLSISNMKPNVSFHKQAIAGRNSLTPFIYADSENNLVINGHVEQNIESWVYAGVANRLIAQALSIEGVLSPELSLEQRTQSHKNSAIAQQLPKKRQSAELWLMGLLIICWFAERWLAPKRGM